MSAQQPAGYSSPQRALHWLTAILFVALAVIGFVMSDADPDGALRLWLSRAHAILGLATGGTLVARLVLRSRGPKPEPLPMPPARRTLLRAVHAGMYGAMFALLASGMSTSILGGWSAYLRGEVASAPDLHPIVPREVHEALVFVVIALVAVHVAGVLLFETQHGGALARMLPARGERARS